jgi:hypothetical protein
MKLANVGQVMSGNITIMASELVESGDVLKKANELTLEGEAPVIVEVNQGLANDVLNEDVPVDPSKLSLKDPHELGIEGTTSNNIYQLIKKQSKSMILSKIANNNLSDAKKVIKLYSKIVDKAKRLNIKNAEEASLMTAIKKSGVKYAL